MKSIKIMILLAFVTSAAHASEATLLFCEGADLTFLANGWNEPHGVVGALIYSENEIIDGKEEVVEKEKSTFCSEKDGKGGTVCQIQTGLDQGYTVIINNNDGKYVATLHLMKETLEEKARRVEIPCSEY